MYVHYYRKFLWHQYSRFLRFSKNHENLMTLKKETRKCNGLVRKNYAKSRKLIVIKYCPSNIALPISTLSLLSSLDLVWHHSLLSLIPILSKLLCMISVNSSCMLPWNNLDKSRTALFTSSLIYEKIKEQLL